MKIRSSFLLWIPQFCLRFLNLVWGTSICSRYLDFIKLGLFVVPHFCDTSMRHYLTAFLFLNLKIFVCGAGKPQNFRLRRAKPQKYLPAAHHNLQILACGAQKPQNFRLRRAKTPKTLPVARQNLTIFACGAQKPQNFSCASPKPQNFCLRRITSWFITSKFSPKVLHNLKIIGLYNPMFKIFGCVAPSREAARRKNLR